MPLLNNWLSPANLLFHLIEVHRPVISVGENHEPVRIPERIHANIRANVQPAMPEVIQTYSRPESLPTHSIFIIDQEVYDDITTESLITFGGLFYKIVGKIDLCSRGVVYRIDVRREVTR